MGSCCCCQCIMWMYHDLLCLCILCSRLNFTGRCISLSDSTSHIYTAAARDWWEGVSSLFSTVAEIFHLHFIATTKSKRLKPNISSLSHLPLPASLLPLTFIYQWKPPSSSLMPFRIFSFYYIITKHCWLYLLFFKSSNSYIYILYNYPFPHNLHWHWQYMIRL